MTTKSGAASQKRVDVKGTPTLRKIKTEPAPKRLIDLTADDLRETVAEVVAEYLDAQPTAKPPLRT